MNLDHIRQTLIDEIGLKPQEASLYLLVTTEGRMSPEEIARRLDMSSTSCTELCDRMVDLGAFIMMPHWYEATHPRFAAVRMYRQICTSRGEVPGRSKAADGVGAALEDAYDAARTKYIGR